jgi:ubiquinone/menaquinone biosynthesis C-methylase UbiE
MANYASGLVGSIEQRVDKARYVAQQNSLLALLGAAVKFGHLMLGPNAPAAAPPGAMKLLERRYHDLLARDLENVQRGDYPRDLLFQIPWRYYARQVPGTLFDMPRVFRRVKKRDPHELPEGVDLSAYPKYYRRTFHWQTDGWLSDNSAKRYDIGVEILFAGTADVMRRQALPPLVRELRNREHPRLLDIACGTGRFLSQAHRALPNAKLYGLDLSPFYLARARKVLHDVADVSLVAENAEKMPFANDTFDAISSVFLFHELPKDARRAVMREAWRVLAPGGVFVVCDSNQHAESSELSHYLRAFAELYHEPYYKGFIDDDLVEIMRECDFEVESSEPHFLSKVVVGRKPLRHS